MAYETLFLLSLLVTLCIEVPVVFFLVRKKALNISPADSIVISATASLLTLPYLWFIFPVYITNYTLYVIIGEIVVTIIEAVIYWRLFRISMTQALVLSVIANVSSVIFGFLIMRFAF